MKSLVEAADAPDYGARVAAVISDRPLADGLVAAAAAGVPTAVVAPADFADRATWDEALARTVSTFEPDLVVCAGFMRLLGAPMLTQFAGRIVNAHPAIVDLLKNEERGAVQEAERRYTRRIELVARKEYHLEQFDLTGK